MLELFSQHYEDSAAENRGMGKGRCTYLYKLMNGRSSLIIMLPSDGLNQPFLVDMAVKYFRLAEALYYRILEAIVEREKMILGDADLSVSTNYTTFHVNQSFD